MLNTLLKVIEEVLLNLRSICVSFSEITALPIIDAMLRFAQSSNTQLSNLATIFLQVRNKMFYIEYLFLQQPNDLLDSCFSHYIPYFASLLPKLLNCA